MKKLFSMVLLVAVLLFATGNASQAKDLPMPDKNGDYSGSTNHMNWVVTDPDPAGLNGRLSPEFPDNYNDFGAQWPAMNINEWPVITRFPQGTRLIGIRNDRGSTIIVNDQRGKPWLLVEFTELKPCFVRANSNFIRPVNP